MEKVVICVVHLKPLPGSPEYESFEAVIESAIKDARAIEEGGADALIVENYGDKPFLLTVGKETVACMTAVAMEIKREVDLPIGINILRNDAIASLAVAKAVNADFIRVNQLYFQSLAPEGILFGNAGEIARYKKMIDCNAMIFADINVKHAKHLVSIEDYLLNVERSFADAVIVTGKTTGKKVDTNELKLVKEFVRVPVLAGSGVTPSNVNEIIKYCDGVIVGTYIKRGGAIDADRVKKIVKAVKKG